MNPHIKEHHSVRVTGILSSVREADSQVRFATSPQSSFGGNFGPWVLPTLCWSKTSLIESKSSLFNSWLSCFWTDSEPEATGSLSPCLHLLQHCEFVFVLQEHAYWKHWVVFHHARKIRTEVKVVEQGSFVDDFRVQRRVELVADEF